MRKLPLHSAVMAASWWTGVSGVLLFLLPAVLAELRIAGAVEELDQGMTSFSTSCHPNRGDEAGCVTPTGGGPLHKG